jgi:hypothetical protein
MKRHLDRKKKCSRSSNSLNYDDEEIYLLSLTSKNDNKYITTTHKLTCTMCNKSFARVDTLKRHQNTVCSKEKKQSTFVSKEIHIDNQINNKIENQQINNINNYYIINELKSFDDEWNVEHMDKYIKLFILLSNTKYTDFLNELLKNEENLNIIIDKDSDAGLVYKNKKEMYVQLKVKEILSQTMLKMNEQLDKLYNEYLLNNKNINEHIIRSIKIEKNKNIDKYNDYVNNDDIKNKVDNLLSDIFSKKKEDAIIASKNLISNIENGY